MTFLGWLCDSFKGWKGDLRRSVIKRSRIESPGNESSVSCFGLWSLASMSTVEIAALFDLERKKSLFLSIEMVLGSINPYFIVLLTTNSVTC